MEARENDIRVLILYTEEVENEINASVESEINESLDSQLSEDEKNAEVIKRMENRANYFINMADYSLKASGTSVRLTLVLADESEGRFTKVITSQEKILEDGYPDDSSLISGLKHINCDRPGCYFHNENGETAIEKQSFEYYWWPYRGNYFLENDSDVADIRTSTNADIVVLLSSEFNNKPPTVKDYEDEGYRVCSSEADCTNSRGCLIVNEEAGGGWYIDKDENKKDLGPGEGMCVTALPGIAGSVRGVTTGESVYDAKTSIFSMEYNGYSQTFIHEIGRLFGLALHNIDAECGFKSLEDCNKVDTIYRGHVDLNQLTCSVMSYKTTCSKLLPNGSGDKCRRFSYFSNPFIYIDNNPAGKFNTSFSACALEKMADYVGNFYEYWSEEKAYSSHPRPLVCEPEDIEKITTNMQYTCDGLEINDSDSVNNNVRKLKNLYGCTHIEGDLVIEGMVRNSFKWITPSGINPFRKLETISGKFVIKDTNLNQLSYFSNLKEVGSFEVEGNASLESPMRSYFPFYFPFNSGSNNSSKSRIEFLR